jgi:hypothetical protein
MRRLLRELLAFNDVLDVLLVLAAGIVVTPPNRSLVLALQTKVLASSAHGISLIALLSSQPASVAA